MSQLLLKEQQMHFKNAMAFCRARFFFVIINCNILFVKLGLRINAAKGRLNSAV